MPRKHRVSLFDKQPDFFAPGLEVYAEQNTSDPPPLLQELETETMAMGMQSIMLVDRKLGRLLKMLAATLRPQLALDV